MGLQQSSREVIQPKFIREPNNIYKLQQLRGQKAKKMVDTGFKLWYTGMTASMEW
jgi:hypothetical protein